MAAFTNYTVPQDTTLLRLCSQKLAQAGYSDTSTMQEAVRVANPQLGKLRIIPAGTVIQLPHAT